MRGNIWKTSFNNKFQNVATLWSAEIELFVCLQIVADCIYLDISTLCKANTDKNYGHAYFLVSTIQKTLQMVLKAMKEEKLSRFIMKQVATLWCFQTENN